MNPLHQELVNFYQKKGFNKSVEQDHWRLQYHVMPPTGWLNDPNGVIQFGDTYHLYYQYSPHDAEGGLKYWGHKTSTDLVHFDDHGIALYPDQPYDLHGVYSGTAFAEGEKIHYFYTGNVKHLGDHDYIKSGREQNTVHAISHDGGKTIEKVKCVIHADDYPEQFSQHIRDPKVFKKDGVYYMLLGARDLQDQGQVLTYRSEDLSNWHYHGVFAGPIDGLGYMWECPDYIEFEDTDLLIFSPQGIDSRGHDYHNVYQAGYMLGELAQSTMQFSPSEKFIELDRGFDFYAPQTFLDQQGRRIMWGWMGLPDEDGTIINPTIEKGWQHAMTLPRELTVEEGRLKQRPLPEYEKLRGELFETSISFKDSFQTDQLKGDVFELLVEIDEMHDRFEIHLREDCVLTYDARAKLFHLTLGESGYGRGKRTLELDSLRQLHIFSDSSSLEVFINDGDDVFTTRLYPEPNQNQIALKGNAKVSIKKWDLSK